MPPISSSVKQRIGRRGPSRLHGRIRAIYRFMTSKRTRMQSAEHRVQNSGRYLHNDVAVYKRLADDLSRVSTEFIPGTESAIVLPSTGPESVIFWTAALQSTDADVRIFSSASRSRHRTVAHHPLGADCGQPPAAEESVDPPHCDCDVICLRPVPIDISSISSFPLPLPSPISHPLERLVMPDNRQEPGVGGQEPSHSGQPMSVRQSIHPVSDGPRRLVDRWAKWNTTQAVCQRMQLYCCRWMLNGMEIRGTRQTMFTLGTR